MKHLAAVISLVPFLAVAACSKAPRSDALTAEDLHIAQQAMPVSEALLMIRAGYKESQIIGDLKKRHIPGPIDANTEDQFLKAGASPALISALNSKENALTENQRGAYQKYQAEKSNRVTQSAQTRRNEDFIRQQEEQQELYRRRSLQQQTLQNINRSQSAQVSYEVAQRNYETQRKSLEQQITSLEASINWKRSHGYRESELAVANQALEDYRKQLRDLTPRYADAICWQNLFNCSGGNTVGRDESLARLLFRESEPDRIAIRISVSALPPGLDGLIRPLNAD